MRYVYLTYFFVVIAAIAILGSRGTKTTARPLEIWDDMDHMPKYHPQGKSGFFADGRADRLPVEGTIARGTYFEDEYYQTGKIGAEYGSGYPADFEINASTMARAEENFGIYCAVCHGAAGDGAGRIKDIAPDETAIIPGLLGDITVGYPEGQLYDIIANGKNLMGAYGDKLSVEDRWGVVLYVRALQRAANGTAKDLTPAKREELGL